MRHAFILIVMMVFQVGIAFSQTVVNCETPRPASDNTVYPWYYNANSRVNWNTSDYRPFIINKLPIRLLFPLDFDSTTVAANSYPLAIMMHGIGEAGNTTKSECDNDFQLVYGARNHLNARNKGTYTGFVMAYQSDASFLAAASYPTIIKFIELAIRDLGVDPNRVTVHGLSGGGAAAWNFANLYPNDIAAAIPMSSASNKQTEPPYIEKIKFKAIWQSQGGLDKAPTPTSGNNVANAFASAGANHTYTFYPDLGHGTWNRMYSEADFFPFLERASMLNIHPLNFKSNFCAGETITGTLGIQSGFAIYEWQRNGATIAGATGNSITFNSLGSYRVRFKRTSASTWTEWSKPLQVKMVGASPTPVIIADGPTALPTLDGRTSVNIASGASIYNTYGWSNGASSSSINVTEGGAYQLIGTVRNGCPSDPSNIIKVTYNVNNALPGPGLPQIDVAGQGTLILRWNDNSTNEKGFELYHGFTSEGPWNLTARLSANVTEFIHTNLNANTRYYYKLRAVNSDGGSPYSSGNARTISDEAKPTTPSNLNLLGTTRTMAVLNWNPSVDNTDAKGILDYEIWDKQTNTLLLTTTDTIAKLNTENGLVSGQAYTFAIRAKDRAGNTSDFSAQVTGKLVADGLFYSYYVHDNLSFVDQIEDISPSVMGNMPEVALEPRTQDNKFAFIYEGHLNIPTTGNYAFSLRSDDGSKLYIDNDEIVDNDGAHGSKEITTSGVNLTAGLHKVKILYFENGGGEILQFSWAGPGITKQLVPTSAFKENFSPLNAPVAPSNLAISGSTYNTVALTWQDNSNNETGFEVLRSTNNSGPFVRVATTNANATSFADNNLEGSTRYFYKVRAIGNTGESDYAGYSPSLDFNYHTGSFSSLSTIINGTAPIASSGKLDYFTFDPKGSRTTYFAFRWAGKIWLPETEDYTFYLKSDDGSAIYIDNQLLVDYNSSSNMSGEKSGTRTLSKGFHTIMVAYRQVTSSYGLEVRYSSNSLPKQLISAEAVAQEWISGTTTTAPAGPNTPANFNAVASSSNSIKISWTDAATNETGFEVFRNNILLATIAQPNATTYTDGTVLANTPYSYKIRAYNQYKGQFTNQLTAVAGNSSPVISPIGNISARYNYSTTFEITASDIDRDAITLSAADLPSFCSLADNRDGTATLLVESTSFYDQKTYQNIAITATDIYGASSTEIISLTINSNVIPVFNPVSLQLVKEGEVLSVPISANDANGDAMTFSLEAGSPAFASLSNVKNGLAMLKLAPAIGVSGDYTLVIKVVDSKNGISKKAINVKVGKKADAKVVKLNFNDKIHLQAVSPWSNFGQFPSANTFIDNLPATDGTNSGIKITMLSGFSRNNLGVYTGDDSGIYPDAVLNTFIFGNADTKVRTIKVSGLNPALTYAFELLGSTTIEGTGPTAYTIGGLTKSLNTYNNKSETVRFTTLRPNAAGEILLDIKRLTTGASYLNSIIIESMFDDASVPTTPTGLKANLGSNGEVNLTWNDLAYNEIGYEVQRSISGGSFATIQTIAAESNSFFDTEVAGKKTYAYKIRALGNYANSGWSNQISVAVPNRAPVITNLPSLVGGKEGRVTEFAFTISDRENDNIMLTAINLPAFATLSKVSNTQGKITITNPSSDLRGNHPGIYIIASDGTEDDVKLIMLRVTDSEKVSTLVNFNGKNEAPAPWNNMNGRYTKNSFITNLKNELNENTGFTLTLLDAWNGFENYGEDTGDNSGRYRDDVLKSYMFTSNTGSRSMRISGLKPNMRYNIRALSSSNYQSLNGSTELSGNSQILSQAVQSNVNNTVQINGIIADQTGAITFSMKKLDGKFAFINALEILEYDNNGLLLRPDNLLAEASKNVDDIQNGYHMVSLGWEDNSYQESGYKIERRVLPNGSFTTIATAAANTTRYIDKTVQRATSYEYRVKAVNGGASSAYSLPKTVRTLDWVIYINMNAGSNNVPNADIWNNMSRAPSSGFIKKNFSRMYEWEDPLTYNDSGEITSFRYPTSVDIEMVQEFEGTNNFGPTAPDNNPIHKNVVKSFYFNEIGTISVTKIGDLNPNQLYNIRFYAGSGFGTQNGVTEYRINNKKVHLDVQLNLTNTVVISNVQPDKSGNIYFEAEAGESARYAYLNGLMIESQGDINTNGARVSASANATATQISKPGDLIDVFPNPTESRLNVRFDASVSDRAYIAVMDLAGRTVLQKEYSIAEGSNTLEIDVQHENFKTGVYLLRIKTSEFESKIIRFVKQ